MVDTVRGVLRVRKWPRKRGKPTSAAQLFWIDWFKQANLLAKYASAYDSARAIAITAKSGMYPRDVILAAMRGRLYTWVDQDGWRWFPVAAIDDISESLDVLGQTVGDILVRAVDRWRPPTPGALSDVLVNQGPGNPPKWAPSPGIGSVIEEVVLGTPIVPDNTKSSYVLDISIYTKLVVIVDNLGFAAADRLGFRFSIDGGVTFKSGASDYQQVWVRSAASGSSAVDQIRSSNSTGTTGHDTRITFDTLRAGRASCSMNAFNTGNFTIARDVYCRFDGPMTDIKLFSQNGNNMNAGTIRVVGTR